MHWTNCKLQPQLTYFHLQGWGLVVDGDGFPLSGVWVDLRACGESWVLETDEKKDGNNHHKHDRWMTNVFFFLMISGKTVYAFHKQETMTLWHYNHIKIDNFQIHESDI